MGRSNHTKFLATPLTTEYACLLNNIFIPIARTHANAIFLIKRAIKERYNV